MNANSKIYVAGHRGLVGSALLRALERHGFKRHVVRTHPELDLKRQEAVDAFFRAEKPDTVFLAAARVGGVHANNTYPAEFIYENLVVQTNVMESAFRHGARELLFLGSSCIYPNDRDRPIKESDFMNGPLEPTNDAYAIAKIAGIKTCQAYRKQYGVKYLAVMPTNLYGPNDNYHPENSHVLPAFLRRFHEAVQAGKDAVTIWGTGKPKREFLHVDDMAEAAIHVMLNYDGNEIINIGCGTDQTIRELAELVARVTGFSGRIAFDPTKPDGTPRKLLDVSRIRSMGWEPRIPLESGVKTTYAVMKQEIAEGRWRG